MSKQEMPLDIDWGGYYNLATNLNFFRDYFMQRPVFLDDKFDIVIPKSEPTYIQMVGRQERIQHKEELVSQTNRVGGRSSVYFIDEASYYPFTKTIEFTAENRVKEMVRQSVDIEMRPKTNAYTCTTNEPIEQQLKRLCR